MDKPLIPIVNESDEVIGQKDRHAVDPVREIYRVSAVWVFNTKGQILLAQRKFTKKKEPGLWGPSVAGTVEVGETYEENAYKETQEELGLEHFELEEVGKTRIKEPFNFFVHVYRTVVDIPAEAFRIQEEEVEQVMWHDIDELLNDATLHPDKYVKNIIADIKFLEQSRSAV